MAKREKLEKKVHGGGGNAAYPTGDDTEAFHQKTTDTIRLHDREEFRETTTTYFRETATPHFSVKQKRHGNKNVPVIIEGSEVVATMLSNLGSNPLSYCEK